MEILDETHGNQPQLNSGCHMHEFHAERKNTVHNLLCKMTVCYKNQMHFRLQ